MNVGNISNIIIDKVDSFNRVRQTDARGQSRVKNVEDGGAVKVMAKSEVFEAVDRLNEAMVGLNERISFSYHEKTNRVIVKVIDANTNEVVREIPPKDLIKLLEHLKEFAGVFVDESR